MFLKPPAAAKPCADCNLETKKLDFTTLNISLKIWSSLRAGATFDWVFFDNSKLIEFDD